MKRAVEDGVKDAVNEYNGTQKDQINYLQEEVRIFMIFEIIK